MRATRPVWFALAVTVAACSPRQQGDSAERSAAAASTPKACAALAALALPQTKIASVETVAAGAFRVPLPPGVSQADYSKLPSFCRVTGTIAPSADSDIRFEVWLPEQGWNGKFMQTGNGGAAGFIFYDTLADSLARGYAVANTDTGHQGGIDGIGDFGWAANHPEKLTDYQYRAVHELTVAGKAVTSARYGKDPDRCTGSAARRAADKVSRKRSASRTITTQSSPERRRTTGRRSWHSASSPSAI